MLIVEGVRVLVSRREAQILLQRGPKVEKARPEVMVI